MAGGAKPKTESPKRSSDATFTSSHRLRQKEPLPPGLLFCFDTIREIYLRLLYTPH